MTAMLKIGLTQRVTVLPDRNETRDCLDQAWMRLLIDNGFWPVPLPNCVDDISAMMEALTLDGVILTGGNDLDGLPGGINTAPQRDAFERKLLTYCANQHIPVLGVCRGLQMLVAHYGGMLMRVSGHVACCHAITVEPGCDEILGDRDQVNSFHDWGIMRDGLSEDLQVAAIAPDHTVEAVVHRKYPQLGVMWHPERAPSDERDQRLIRHFFAGIRV